MQPEREAVIFAGGKSSRMGRDKALLPFGGYSTLAEYQYRRLLPLFDRVSLSAKGDKFPFDSPRIYDRDAETSSPMVALASVLEQAQHDIVFVLSVDMPLVDALLIDRLYDAHADHPAAQIILAASPHGTEPLCALYHRDLLPRITEQLERGEHRMHALLKEAVTVKVPCEREEIFTNLNTPEEYYRLLR
ncbi:molybdenum cofactor guanylyltransferase MobA [Nitratifractor sp.]|uniref:molybdenum cofactor guanylyltransferase MobA n=1 Tax=Nitratifractor sp. TaxID=2268144 RepID=UPI0025F97D2A|nr:molybdenum cofactor guanylyltransferase MobA [Nitratifractor sp.]